MTIIEALTGKNAFTEETRLKADELMAACGIDNKRDLQSRIRRERLDGAIILSTKSKGGGFWTSTNYEEIARYTEKLRLEGVACIAAGKSARKFLKTIEGQERLNI